MKKLSPKEFEVIGYIVLGWTNKQIADKLCITVDTVKAHMTSIMRKLGVSNRAKAIYVAIKNNIVDI